MTPSRAPQGGGRPLIDSPYAWLRLGISLLIVAIGNVGVYVASIVLPIIQPEFGIGRADASIPYAVTMIGFGLGGIFIGRLTDRFGIFVCVLLGALALGLGLWVAGTTTSFLGFNLAHGVLIGALGTAAFFAPMVADISHWFQRHRGLAVAICMSGNFLAGTLWPPIMQYFITGHGWRATYIGIAVFCVLTLLPLAFFLRHPPPSRTLPTPGADAAPPARSQRLRAALSDRPLGLSQRALLVLLSLAGIGCCVAMAMPQVQIVAYCMDLGYGLSNGANMLSLMLAMGIISRLGSGWLSDRVGGLNVLLLGSVLQMAALTLYVFNHGLLSLYVISALFGLFQGGIIPAYAVIVRQYFPAAKAGVYIGTVLMATMVGMALGGWMSGAIYDLARSYQAAFINGVAWNVLNAAIVLFLIARAGGFQAACPARQ